MRWDRLFADLDSQAAAAEADEWRIEIAERARAERATVALAGRLATMRGGRVALRLTTGSLVRGTVVEAAGQWCLVVDGPSQHLVPHAAIATVEGLSPGTAHLGRVDDRLTLGSALRVLARDRVAVVIETSAGTLSGTIDRVGADHMDLRAIERITVALSAVAQVRSPSPR